MRAWIYSRACPPAHPNAGYCGCCRCSSCVRLCPRGSCGQDRRRVWNWCYAVGSFALHHPLLQITARMPSMQHTLMRITVRVMSSTTTARTNRRIPIRFAHLRALASVSLKRKSQLQPGSQRLSSLPSRRLPILSSIITLSIVIAFAVRPLAPSAKQSVRLHRGAKRLAHVRSCSIDVCRY